MHPQRPGVVEQAQQQRSALLFIERRIVSMQPGDTQQLGQHRFMLVRALAQVDGSQVKAEHLHRALQRRESGADQCAGMVGAQAVFDHAQVGQQFFRRRIRRLRGHGVAQCLGAGQRVQRGCRA